jgi:pseudouridine synthase
MERLQKVLARAGVASRRAAERLIVERRVAVNGTVVDRLGLRIDPQHDRVHVDGRLVPAAPADHLYLALNKPRGFVTTLSDPEGRPTITDLLRHVPRRVYPVGRLDYHSEGLVLITDDGALARDLMHPSSGVPKLYLVKVRGRPAADALDRAAAGVVLDGRRTAPARLRVVRPSPNAWLEVEVTEGRKHLVRRVLERVGYPVLKLRRIAYGGVKLGTLAPGTLRELTREEVARLKRAAAPPRAAARPPRRRSAARAPRRTT